MVVLLVEVQVRVLLQAAEGEGLELLVERDVAEAELVLGARLEEVLVAALLERVRHVAWISSDSFGPETAVPLGLHLKALSGCHCPHRCEAAGRAATG